MKSRKKIKVLFLCWGYSVHAERRISIFTSDRKFDVSVASTFNYNLTNAKFLKLSNQINLFSNFQLPRLLLSSVKDLLKLQKFVSLVNPDVISLQTLMYPCYLAYFLPARIPRVITFWNGDVTWWAKWNGLERLLKKQIVTYGVKHAAAITVNSTVAMKACLRYRVDKKKVYLIRYPGVDLKKFRPYSKNLARRVLGIKAKRVILWPRGLGGYLNSDVFLKVALKVLQKHPDILFIFLSKVGAELVPSYQSQVELEGFRKNFRWDLQVPIEKMPLYYSAADVMISISSNDSLPNVMLEAMACGTPVIMSDIRQIRDWVQNNKNGYLVSPKSPALLARTIEKVVNPRNNRELRRFTKTNLEKVKREANYRTGSRLIKQLVLKVVEK